MRRQAKEAACRPDLARYVLEKETLIGRKSGSEIAAAYRLYGAGDAASCAYILRANYATLGPCRCGIAGAKAEERFDSFMSDYSEQKISQIARKRNYRVVELAGGPLAGVAGFMPQGEKVLVVDVSVHPSVQKEGIGTFLMASLIRELKSLPFVRFAYLEASRAAVGMYERLGFRSSILHPQQDGEAPVFMKMFL